MRDDACEQTTSTRRLRFPAVSVTAIVLLAASSVLLNAQAAGEGGNSFGFDMAPETSQRWWRRPSSRFPTPMAPGTGETHLGVAQENYKVPTWFRGAKFGIFMHFGIFSVPAHGNEWYEKFLYAGGDDSVLKVLGGNDMALECQQWSEQYARLAHRALRPSGEVRLQGFHSHVQGGTFRRRCVGHAVQKGGCAIRHAGRAAS